MHNRTVFRRGRLDRALQATARALPAALALSVSGCSLDVLDPDIVRPEQLDSPEALPTLLAGAIGDFAFAYAGDNGVTEGIILLGGMRADEWRNADTFDTRQEVDRGRISIDNGTNQAVFRNMHTARRAAEFAAERFEEHAPGSAGHATVLNVAGYTYVLFGENYCPGVPFSSVSQEGQFQFGQPLSTDAMFDEALARFTEAQSIATSAGNTIQQYNAQVGRGRALLNQGDFAGAATAVAGVPTSFVYLVEYSENTPRQNNGVFVFNTVSRRYTAANSEGGNGLPYRTADDPRVPIVALRTASGAQRAGLDAVTPMWVQLKYPDRAANIPLSSGIEARLIEAEAALRANDVPTFINIHNALRATVDGLGPLTPTGLTADELVDLHFRERAFWLYSTAHRLGDMRRLIRPVAEGGYGRAIATVFPVGPYPKGGPPYGDEVNLPVPVDELNNPNFEECESRTR